MFQEDDDWKKIIDGNGDFITPFCESVDTPDDITLDSCSHEGATASLTDTSHVEEEEEPWLRTTSTATRFTHPGTLLAEENIQDTCIVAFDAEEAKNMTADDLAVSMEQALLLGSQTDSQSPEEAIHHVSDVSWFRRLQFGKMVGCGSHGQVYVVDLDGQIFAAKILRACTRHEATQLSSEAKLNLKFSHDNIVTTHKCIAISHQRPSLSGKFSIDDVSCEMWILQELCEAGSLHAVLEDHVFEVGSAKQKEKIVCSVALDIARGLEYLHFQDIIHGDLSSNNVLLQKRNDDTESDNTWNLTAKVNDFGRAKYRQGLKSMKTNTLGTVTYMPPEMLMDGSLKPSLDIYSLGILLVEMWSGQNPWGTANFAQIIFAVSQGKIPCVPDNVPDFLKEIIHKCLSGVAAERPTASDVVRYFESRED
mmetsp:Transcript_3174/g.6408  ORF Transcript_3174/g.6408 Transcript_3174/m.6408 type:complete len:422 (-) Transcript_3174:1134-2399(-)